MNRLKFNPAAVIYGLISVAGGLLTAWSIRMIVSSMALGNMVGAAEGMLFAFFVLPFGLSFIWGGFKRLRFIYLAHQYEKFLRADPEHAISNLAAFTNQTEEVLLERLSSMIDKRYLRFCRIDAQKEHVEFVDPENGAVDMPQKTPAPEELADKEPSSTEAECTRLLQEMGRVKRSITNMAMARQIERIEKITAEIINAVGCDPEKQPKIRMFINYYLPETISLLSAYQQFETHTYVGENLTAAKKEIEDVLEKLITGFEKQLDLLYTGDMIDVSSDVDTLESMMSKDGLLEDELGQLMSQNQRTANGGN